MQITVDQIKAIGAVVYVVCAPEGDFIIIGREGTIIGFSGDVEHPEIFAIVEYTSDVRFECMRVIARLITAIWRNGDSSVLACAKHGIAYENAVVTLQDWYAEYYDNNLQTKLFTFDLDENAQQMFRSLMFSGVMHGETNDFLIAWDVQDYVVAERGVVAKYELPTKLIHEEDDTTTNAILCGMYADKYKTAVGTDGSIESDRNSSRTVRKILGTGKKTTPVMKIAIYETSDSFQTAGVITTGGDRYVIQEATYINNGRVECHAVCYRVNKQWQSLDPCFYRLPDGLAGGDCEIDKITAALAMNISLGISLDKMGACTIARDDHFSVNTINFSSGCQHSLKMRVTDDEFIQMENNYERSWILTDRYWDSDVYNVADITICGSVTDLMEGGCTIVSDPLSAVMSALCCQRFTADCNLKEFSMWIDKYRNLITDEMKRSGTESNVF